MLTGFTRYGEGFFFDLILPDFTEFYEDLCGGIERRMTRFWLVQGHVLIAAVVQSGGACQTSVLDFSFISIT